MAITPQARGALKSNKTFFGKSKDQLVGIYNAARDNYIGAANMPNTFQDIVQEWVPGAYDPVSGVWGPPTLMTHEVTKMNWDKPFIMQDAKSQMDQANTQLTGLYDWYNGSNPDWSPIKANRQGAYSTIRTGTLGVTEGVDISRRTLLGA